MGKNDLNSFTTTTNFIISAVVTYDVFLIHLKMKHLSPSTSLSRILIICCFGALLISCVNTKQYTRTLQGNSAVVAVLGNHNDSDFKQVRATFKVESDLTTSFKVISDLTKTKLWLREVDNIRTVKIDDFNNFLIYTVLNSPWPFSKRETVTCVNTTLTDIEVNIKIRNCSERYPESASYVRVPQIKSSWKILKIDEREIKVIYSAWINPGGNVPAFFFNQQLGQQTTKSLTRLQQLIAATFAEQNKKPQKN